MNTDKCGTTTGWNRHYRAREKPCEPCREAWNAYFRAKRKPKATFCQRCGKQIRSGIMCRGCHQRRLHGEAKRRAAQRRLARAEAGTTGQAWIVGPCGWCGVQLAPTPATSEGYAYCSMPCRRRARTMRRRGREFDAPGEFTWGQVMRIFLLFDKKCAYCEARIEGQPEPDHVIPLSRGGLNSLSNILPCCKRCNSDKRELLLHEWAVDRCRRGLEPRTTAWMAGDQRVRHLAISLPTAS